ncbi:acetyltransferase [Algibacter amylolyticus]|uniref:Acetyltransferase n=1 Tax=Algibacter amylolyticus TaxID=1608400 RepID=A0A5M7B4V9_9FLAO|nr:DapH/DapD/GlmU-related protein [Algibacter amylolyticus]KAA5824419.1 acetyltransferase [Algibacter amylolyticus]MBB5269523.1 sugar O-acyltransferase (sialic acid O-acetyltransferase NeuD family) [Algibacter amylolyticus]TSJ75192.1 acetyltransferase [Algibacter amylolyticus]
MKPTIYLIGVGYYTEVIIELARDCGYQVAGLYHYNEDRVGEIVLGVKIIDTTKALFSGNIKGKKFGVSVGENNTRESISKTIRSLGGETPNLIHPKAVLSPSVEIGVGCFIHAMAILHTATKIGDDCIVSSGSMLGHHASLGNVCFMAPFSLVGAYSTIGERVLFGLNSLILPNKLTLGNDCIVGAKANVTKSFDAKTTLIGSPAKPLKSKK